MSKAAGIAAVGLLLIGMVSCIMGFVLFAITGEESYGQRFIDFALIYCLGGILVILVFATIYGLIKIILEIIDQK